MNALDISATCELLVGRMQRELLDCECRIIANS